MDKNKFEPIPILSVYTIRKLKEQATSLRKLCQKPKKMLEKFQKQLSVS